MQAQVILVTLATALSVIAPVSYTVSIIRGRARPHRMTRLAVLVAMALTFFSLLSSGANMGILLLAGTFFVNCICIFALSMWRGMGGDNLADRACFVLALGGLTCWQISGSPLLGIAFAIFADLVAYIPAFVKAWRYPETESPWFYVGSGLAALLGLMAYPLSPESAFQIYIVLCSATMLICLYHKHLTDWNYENKDQ